MAGRFSVEAIFKAVDKVTAPVTRMQNRIGKFTRSMDRSFRTLNNSVDKLVGGLRRGASTALKVTTAGVGALVGSAILLVREFSKIEDAEAAFTPLLGGAAQARKAVEALNETAASTPFQFEDLAGAAGQLLPVMNGDIENTIRTLRMLGDTAGGNAQKLDSITRGYTKAMLKGKVDMESLNMIAEAGVPIFQDLAEVMGMKTGEKFFKTISKGQVTTDQLNKAFAKLTGEGGKFFKGMEIASQTTSGMWSTLKDNISLTAAELGGVLAPTVKELIQWATTMAQSLRVWVKANRELIATKVSDFIEKAKSAMSGLVSRIQALGENSNILDQVVTVLDGISKAFTFLFEHGATLAKIAAGFVAFSIVLNTFIAVMTAVNLVMALNPVGLIIIGVAALIAGITFLIIKFGGVKKAILGVAEFILKNNPFTLLLDGLSKIVEKLTGFDLKKIFNAKVAGAIDALPASVKAFLGIEAAQEPATAESQMVSPQARTARQIEETRTTNTSEVTLKAEKGTSAEVTKGATGPGLNIARSGAF